MKKKQRQRTSAKSVEIEDARPFSLPHIDAKPESDDDGWDRNGLTLKQRRFVKAMAGVAGGNATKAAEIAGYNANNREALRVTACENLTKPNVQRALARALSRRQGTKAKTLAGIAEIANLNVENYLKPDGTFDLDKARAGGAMGAIKELDIEEIGPGCRRVKVKMHDRLKALALLAQIHGKIIERHEHTGANGQPIEVKNASDYDAIESELRHIGGRMANRAAQDN